MLDTQEADVHVLVTSHDTASALQEVEMEKLCEAPFICAMNAKLVDRDSWISITNLANADRTSTGTRQQLQIYEVTSKKWPISQSRTPFLCVFRENWLDLDRILFVPVDAVSGANLIEPLHLGPKSEHSGDTSHEQAGTVIATPDIWSVQEGNSRDAKADAVHERLPTSAQVRAYAVIHRE